MCIYHYSYVATCRHAEFTRISYCNNAIALGLPRTDSHLPDDPSADDNPGTQSGSSAHPPASSAKNSSSSHSQSHTHTQQQHQSQHNNTMSTLTPSEAGRAPTWDAVVQERDAQVHHQAALVPRSALADGSRTRRSNTLDAASLVLDRPGYSNVNIDIPLDTQSSLHMQVTHDESPDIHADSPTGLETISAPHMEHAEHTVGASGSPRKPIPSHWLPKSTGPNLATAQRAKARTIKKSWDSESPDEVRTLRGTRSSIDFGGPHIREGAMFLTKEALAAVDSTASPTSPISPSRLHGSPSRRPWNSPTGSPLRSSARQQSSFSLRMSPTKSTHLNTESISAAHSRATSSVATSTGRTSFHTAQGSPVRSPASTEHSFQSAPESPEDLNVPSVDLNADSDDEQVHHESGSPGSAATRASLKGKRSSLTPRLSLVIPASDASHDIREGSRETSASAPSSSHIAGSPLGPDSPTHMSRIPRVGTSKSAIPMRGATIKRVESVKSLQNKIKMLQQAMQMDATEIPLPETPAPATLRHVRTVDSTGSTPIISRSSKSYDSEKTARASEDDQEQSLHIRSRVVSANVPSPDQPTDAQCDANYVHVHKSEVEQEMAHKAAQASNLPCSVSSVLAHGNLKLDTKQEEAASASMDRVDDTVENTSPARGRSDRMGSDLRPTAAEFVPRPPPTISPTDATTESMPAAPSLDLAGLPDATVLDRNGIPFLWYMYGVQFAYEQGYRNGRPKSPKKFKQPKKQRSSISSPFDAPHPFSKAVPITNPRPATPLSPAARQRLTSAELMPPPPIPANRRHEETRQKNYHPGFDSAGSNPHTVEPGPNQPFEHQLNLVAEQTALSDRTNSNAPRHFGLNSNPYADLPSGPRNMHPPTYYTVPRHGHRNNRGNGLYGGRGNAAGVPIDATAPFPNPVAPQGRPEQRHSDDTGSVDYSEYTIGKESCGLVNITVATERGGGEPCNACAPDH